MGVHYLSDVVAGAILGIVVAIIGLQFYPLMVEWIGPYIDFPLW
jgi:membrane-associated phospholipid phosphatase